MTEEAVYSMHRSGVRPGDVINHFGERRRVLEIEMGGRRVNLQGFGWAALPERVAVWTLRSEGSLAVSGNERSEALEERLERVEAMLRDHRFHEPDCPERKRLKEQMHTGAMLHPRECECWLSDTQEDR